jgi:hypothetical protein
MNSAEPDLLQTARSGCPLLGVPRAQVLVPPVLVVSWVRMQLGSDLELCLLMCSLRGRGTPAAD